MMFLLILGFPGSSVVKNPPANAGDTGDLGSIPGWKNPLEKEMTIHSNILAWRLLDRGAWQATVHGVTKESHMT